MFHTKHRWSSTGSKVHPNSSISVKTCRSSMVNRIVGHTSCWHNSDSQLHSTTFHSGPISCDFNRSFDRSAPIIWLPSSFSSFPGPSHLERTNSENYDDEEPSQVDSLLDTAIMCSLRSGLIEPVDTYAVDHSSNILPISLSATKRR